MRIKDDLDTEDLVVSLIASIKGNLDRNMNPDFIAILQIELDFALRNKQVYLHSHSVLEIAVNVAETDANDGNGNTNLKCVKVDIALHL